MDKQLLTLKIAKLSTQLSARLQQALMVFHTVTQNEDDSKQCCGSKKCAL